jgi:hypothetical protein
MKGKIELFWIWKYLSAQWSSLDIYLLLLFIFGLCIGPWFLCLLRPEDLWGIGHVKNWNQQMLLLFGAFKNIRERDPKWRLGQRCGQWELHESGTLLRLWRLAWLRWSTMERKLWHPEPLTRGKLLHVTIHWKNRQAAIPTPPLPTCQPAYWAAAHLVATSSKCVWETFGRPNK